MNVERLVKSTGIPQETAEDMIEVLRQVPEETAFKILDLALTGRRTPSGEEWTTEKLQELAQWQAQTELPPEIANAVAILNGLLAGGKYDISVNDTTIIVSPKKPSFLVPRRATRRGKNGEVMITLAIDGKEVAIGSFSELVRALGEEPRHEHGLKTAISIARRKGAVIEITGRPSETVINLARANSDVVVMN